VIETKGPDGISGIKERLRELRAAGNKTTTLDEFNALVRANADDLNVIKADNHDWWAGDGADDEGFKAWIVRRRKELSSPTESLTYQLLVSTIQECSSLNELRGWMREHGDKIDLLDGEESRRFEEIYDATERGLAALENATAGA
jgi:hypothetical protein